MRKFVVLAAFWAAVSFGASAGAETGRDGFVEPDRATQGKTQGKTQAKTQSNGLKALFSLIATKAGDRKTRRKKINQVSFTRDWLDGQPQPEGDANWECLTEALYFEARGETVKGQFAVAEVIMNRVKSSRFPDSPCGVIRQGTGKRYQCQFTYTCDGRDEVIGEPVAYQRVSKVARAIIDGLAGNLTDGATYYHNNSVRPRWANSFTQTARIGVHLFYRPPLRTASTD